MVIAGNFTLHSCREKLKHRYKTKLCKVQIKPWDKGSIEDVNKMYTVVTMYKKDTDGKNIGEREKITLAGSVDDIFKTKVNGMLPDRIVVIAGAGKGKTTAVAKMAYDWAYNVQDSAFEKLPLLFIIRLRDVRAGSSLGEAIIEQLLHDIPVLIPEPLDNFIRMNQELCWIILDGLDEYRGTLNPSASLIKTIVDVIATREMPSCRVLVTTRPHLEHKFEQGELPRIYAKMEIKGFSTENSEQYIEKFFRSDRAIGNKLQTHLHKYDVISELISTPLFCLMICYLWRENFLFGIETQTELFDSVNIFLWHHCRTKSSQYTEEWLSSTVHQLGKIALKGLLSDNNKLVFRPEDFKEKPDVMQDGCELGIIAITSSNEISDTVFHEPTKMQSIEFYHKLAQEHTAGKYLAKITTTVKMALNVSKLDSVMRSKSQCIGNYEHLLRFASGRNNDICFRIITRILSNKSLDDSERYRIILDCSSESPGLEGNVSSMVQGCVTDGTITLKSPTVYTVVGMEKLPHSLKNEVCITCPSIQTLHFDNGPLFSYGTEINTEFDILEE